MSNYDNIAVAHRSDMMIKNPHLVKNRYSANVWRIFIDRATVADGEIPDLCAITEDNEVIVLNKTGSGITYVENVRAIERFEIPQETGDNGEPVFIEFLTKDGEPYPFEEGTEYLCVPTFYNDGGFVPGWVVDKDITGVWVRTLLPCFVDIGAFIRK